MLRVDKVGVAEKHTMEKAMNFMVRWKREFKVNSTKKLHPGWQDVPYFEHFFVKNLNQILWF